MDGLQFLHICQWAWCGWFDQGVLHVVKVLSAPPVAAPRQYTEQINEKSGLRLRVGGNSQEQCFGTLSRNEAGSFVLALSHNGKVGQEVPADVGTPVHKSELPC